MKPGYLLEARESRVVIDSDGEQYLVAQGTVLLCTASMKLPAGNFQGERTELTLFDAKRNRLFVTHPFWLKIISKN